MRALLAERLKSCIEPSDDRIAEGMPSIPAESAICSHGDQPAPPLGVSWYLW
jgi:hypothetical protein